LPKRQRALYAIQEPVAKSAPAPLEVPSLDAIRAAAGATFRFLAMDATMPHADAATKGAALGVSADVFRTMACRGRRLTKPLLQSIT